MHGGAKSKSKSKSKKSKNVKSVKPKAVKSKSKSKSVKKMNGGMSHKSKSKSKKVKPVKQAKSKSKSKSGKSKSKSSKSKSKQAGGAEKHRGDGLLGFTLLRKHIAKTLNIPLSPRISKFASQFLADSKKAILHEVENMETKKKSLKLGEKAIEFFDKYLSKHSKPNVVVEVGKITIGKKSKKSK